ncbi:MAG: hypothetical protein ACLFVO_19675 [Chloroflexaceae bacterium]
MVSHNASITDLGTLSQEHRGSLAMWLFMPVGLFFLLIALFYTYITISYRRPAAAACTTVSICLVSWPEDAGLCI